jgi:hypothetical protein
VLEPALNPQHQASVAICTYVVGLSHAMGFVRSSGISPLSGEWVAQLGASSCVIEMTSVGQSCACSNGPGPLATACAHSLLLFFFVCMCKCLSKSRRLLFVCARLVCSVLGVSQRLPQASWQRVLCTDSPWVAVALATWQNTSGWPLVIVQPCLCVRAVPCLCAVCVVCVKLVGRRQRL